MSQVHQSAVVDTKAEIGEDSVIGPYCVIGPNVRIGKGTKLMSHVVLDGHTTLGAGCNIFPFASIGTQTQDLKFKGDVTYVEIGDRTTIREYVTVNSSTNKGEITSIGSDCHIMAYSHIAHLCHVGNGVIMANCASLAGHVTVEDQAIIGGLTGVHQFVRIGRNCMIGGMTRVNQDCPPFMMIEGNPARVWGLNSTGLKRRNISDETRKSLKNAYRILYRQGLTTSDALQKVKDEIDDGPEIQHLCDFISKSERGIIK